jgi:hypothetical protein
LQLKTTSIKGKDYVEVNTRLKYFRESGRYVGWCLTTEVIELTPDWTVLKAVIRDDKDRVVATGIAYEKAGSSPINKTSYVENCETSAWGRALGNLGIGIDKSVATFDEVSSAIKLQSNPVVPKEKGPVYNHDDRTHKKQLIEMLLAHGCKDIDIAKQASLEANGSVLVANLSEYVGHFLEFKGPETDRYTR